MAQHDQTQPHTHPSGGFAAWLKRFKRFFRVRERRLETHRLERDIDKLEHERRREKTALLQQRRFYENLLRRRPASSLSSTPAPAPTAVSAPAEKALVKEKPESPFKRVEPVAETVAAPVAETETPRPSEPVSQPAPSALSSTLSKVFAKAKPAETPQPLPPETKKPESSAGRSRLAQKLAAEREKEEQSQQKTEVEERFWQPYGSVKTNLVKDQGVLFFNWRQRLLVLGLSLVLCCLALSLVYVGLLVWQKERLDASATTFANFDAINTEISKNEKDIQDIVSFNRKLELVSFVLANHVYWTNFMTFLEDNTLKDVYLENFGGELNGTYTVPAVAKNLDTVSLQLEVYKAYPKMRSVTYANAQTVDGAPGTDPITKFNLQMSLDPSVFMK